MKNQFKHKTSRTISPFYETLARIHVFFFIESVFHAFTGHKGRYTRGILLPGHAPGSFCTCQYPGGGGGVLPCKGFMGTCGQPGYVFRDFCLKQGIDLIIFCLNQGIDFINFCLKQGISSWTINNLRVCSTNVLNRVSKIGILS